MAIIRQLTTDERREMQEPLQATARREMKRKIEEQEFIMQNEKKPFCRPCVWRDYEEAEALHKLDAQLTGEVKPFTLPDPKDVKYWIFNETGAKDRFEELILAGIKQKVVTGKYVHYQCKLRGHTCRMLIEKEHERTTERTPTVVVDTKTTEVNKASQSKPTRKKESTTTTGKD